MVAARHGWALALVLGQLAPAATARGQAPDEGTHGTPGDGEAEIAPRPPADDGPPGPDTPRGRDAGERPTELAPPPPDTVLPPSPARAGAPAPPTYTAAPGTAPLTPKRPPALPPATQGGPGPEEPRNANRIELVVFQSVNGFALGIEACVLVGCVDDRAFVGAGLLGAAGAFALTFGLTTGGVRPGTSASLNTGFVLGLWHAGAIVGMVQPFDGPAIAGPLMLGQLAGLGLGALLDAALRPTEGRVVTARAASLWASALTGLVLGTLPDDVDQATVFGAMLAVGDLAFLLAGTGGYDALRPSRRRVLTASGLGLAGTGVGLALAYSFLESPARQPVFGAGAAGLLVGLTVGMLITRGQTEDVAGDDPDFAFVLEPTPGGAVARVHGAW